MRQLETKSLDKISGGDSTISGPIINAVVNIIVLIKEAGYDLGSGIRRMAEDEMCPLN